MARTRTTVGIIGAGSMGSALLAGILRSGYEPHDVMVTTRTAGSARALARAHGVRAVDNLTAATADTVLVAVKPRDVGAVLGEIEGAVSAETLVICVAAGITTVFLEQHLPEQVPVARVMPNTPSLVGKGMAAVTAGSSATAADLEDVRRLLGGTGEVVEVAEQQQDAVTGVSGSGPAYVFLVAEALIDAGVTAGLPRPVATQLATQTLLGAATMLTEPGAHPGRLREQVTSPGGTTAAGLRALEEHGVRAAFMDAVAAAAARSADLAGPD